MATLFRSVVHKWRSVCPEVTGILSQLNVRPLNSVVICTSNQLIPSSVFHYSTQTTAISTDNTSDELVPERLYSKINIKVKSYEYAVLDSYIKFIITAGKALDINIGGKVALPTRTEKFTVIKSPHVYKKHRVQYEIRTHSRLVQIKEITGTTADVFLEYIQRNLPEGVTMSVYQEELEALPKLLMESFANTTSAPEKVVKKP